MYIYIYISVKVEGAIYPVRVDNKTIKNGKVKTYYALK